MPHGVACLYLSSRKVYLLGCNSVVEHSPGTRKALGLSPSTGEKQINPNKEHLSYVCEEMSKGEFIDGKCVASFLTGQFDGTEPV